MDLQTRKLELIQEFLKVESEELILRIEKLISKEKNETDDHRLRPFTMEEYNARIDQAMEDSRNGRFISAEDLKEKIKTWG